MGETSDELCGFPLCRWWRNMFWGTHTNMFCMHLYAKPHVCRQTIRTTLGIITIYNRLAIIYGHILYTNLIINCTLMSNIKKFLWSVQEFFCNRNKMSVFTKMCQSQSNGMLIFTKPQKKPKLIALAQEYTTTCVLKTKPRKKYHQDLLSSVMMLLCVVRVCF